MGASLSRREASSDEPDATAPLRGDDDEALRGDESASAPEASAALKRPRSCSKAEVCFTRVLEDKLKATIKPQYHQAPPSTPFGLLEGGRKWYVGDGIGIKTLCQALTVANLPKPSFQTSF